MWNSLLAFIFQISNLNAQIWVLWAEKHQLSNLLMKHCLYLIMTMVIMSDFKSDSGCFQNFQTKMPKFVHFGSIIITVQKFQLSDWSNGVQLNCLF